MRLVKYHINVAILYFAPISRGKKIYEFGELLTTHPPPKIPPTSVRVREQDRVSDGSLQYFGTLTFVTHLYLYSTNKTIGTHNSFDDASHRPTVPLGFAFY